MVAVFFGFIYSKAMVHFCRGRNSLWMKCSSNLSMLTTYIFHLLSIVKNSALFSFFQRWELRDMPRSSWKKKQVKVWTREWCGMSCFLTDFISRSTTLIIQAVDASDVLFVSFKCHRAYFVLIRCAFAEQVPSDLHSQPSEQRHSVHAAQAIRGLRPSGGL